MSQVNQQEPVRGEVLRLAAEATLKNRNAVYGDPFTDMQCAAELCDVFTRYAELKYHAAHDEAIGRVFIKLARIACGAPGHMDNYVDAAAYIAIAAECQDKHDSQINSLEEIDYSDSPYRKNRTDKTLLKYGREDTLAVDGLSIKQGKPLQRNENAVVNAMRGAQLTKDDLDAIIAHGIPKTQEIPRLVPRQVADNLDRLTWIFRPFDCAKEGIREGLVFRIANSEVVYKVHDIITTTGAPQDHMFNAIFTDPATDKQKSQMMRVAAIKDVA